MGLFSSLTRLFGTAEKAEANDAELTRLRKRSEHFRVLLAANHRTLDAVTELGEAACGSEAVTMPFIRSRTVRAAAGARTMVEQLCAMRPGKYELLRESLASVTRAVTAEIATDRRDTSGPPVLDIREIGTDTIRLTGSKAAGMGEMVRTMGLDVPDGFVLTASACARFLAEGPGSEIERLIQAAEARSLEEKWTLSAAVARLICSSPFPEDIRCALQEADERLTARSGEGLYAVRSSALDEDRAGASFAGQYRSILNIASEELEEACREVIASLWSVPAMAYREAKGMRDDESLMAVCCMRMVDARSGGVLYTSDPLSSSPDTASIIAAPGLPKSIADGDLDPDEWVIHRESGEVIHSKTGNRSPKHQEPAGEEPINAPDSGASPSPCLTETETAELVRAARHIESILGAPQDVEWALDRDGHLFFLQCRPLELYASSARNADPDNPNFPAPLASGGRTGAPGAAAGPVRIIRREYDLFRFPAGGVLAANTASPRYAPALPRAAALVTEHGSKAGHLANVAREFGIPALFGIPGCVELLEKTDVVTVDADAGCIYPGEVEELTASRKALLKESAETPTMKTLRAVLEHVSPLNLIDPDSPDFSPLNCTTIHDITRFCHEKGVAEMFGTGQDAPETSKAKRLSLNGRTMQYWIVDLEDCFLKDSGKTIEPTDIDCPPMHAVWKGMTAVPWAGPPVTGKGLLSVMAQSAVGTGASSSLHSVQKMRSCFLIGRNHCTLQSRLGCHFCTVEGYAGENPEENYALMQFMGGAASGHLRHKRVVLCAETLDRYGFITSVRGDVLTARRENMSREQTLTALSMLGYLLMHTRQLDMAMGSEEMRRRFAASFTTDLNRLALSETVDSSTTSDSNQPAGKEESHG